MSEGTRHRRRDAIRSIFGRGQMLQRNSAITSRPVIASAQARPTLTAITASPSGRDPNSLSKKTTFSESVLSSLTPDEQGVVRRHLADNAGNVGDAVQKAHEAALAQKRECESKQWRFTFRGRDVVLRDEADKVVRWIGRFRSVGDVIANIDPIHVGLPWAGIRMILEVAVTGSHQMAVLLCGMNLATYMVDRLQVYLIWRAHLPDTPTTATFEKALVKMYVAVLRFFDGAIETYREGLTTRAWKALWTQSELDEFESTCRNWAIQVDIDASNCDRELSQQERDETKRWREATLTSALDRITNDISDVLTGQQAAKHRSIIDWLSPPDPYSNHYTACNKREPKTGDWLLQSHKYNHWKKSDDTLLWLTGQAGCGKTVLCSTVIEDLRSHCQNTPDTRFAFFYFSFSETRKQSYGNFLLSLVAQLSHSKVGFNEIEQLHHRIYPTEPSTEALEDIVSACLCQPGKTTLVVDALDELPEDNDSDGRPAVMEWLERVMQASHLLKVFITSRQLADIEDSVTSLGARCVLLHPDLADDDIRKYVATELERNAKLRRFDADTKEKIKKVFQEKSGGMFRWAFCQLEELKKLKLTGPKFVEQALQRLPRTLDGTYERMLLQIDDTFHEEALKALRWLTFESRPLTLGELAEACLIDYTSGDLVDLNGRGRADEILELLAGLVLVEDPEDHRSDEEDVSRQSRNSSQDNTEEFEPLHVQSASVKSWIRLAHFSVKEYLTSSRIAQGKTAGFALSEDQDHEILAQSCLAYLLYYSRSQSKTSSEQDLDIFPFLQYAAKTWTRLIPKHQLSQTAYEITLLKSEEHRRDWLSVYQPDEDWCPAFSGYELQYGSVLYYASLIGLIPVSQYFVKQSADVNAQGGKYGNALQTASHEGHIKVVKLLLDSGADVNAQGGDYGTALQAASYKGGRVEVLKLLLDSGADVNAQGGFLGTALQAASYGGHDVEMVKLLLDSGADVNAQNGFYGNALQAASYGGDDVEVVKLLLDSGADVNAQGGRYGTALQVASYGGHDKVVKLLLDSGADVNAQGGLYGIALQAASYGGHDEVVKLLVDSGADVNAQGGDYGTALQAASYRGDCVEVVKLLLDSGADVNAQGGRYGTALQAASYGGYDEVVKLLLDRGAKIHLQQGEFGSALHAAAYQNNENIIRHLLRQQVDLAARDCHGWTPAMIASVCGHSRMAELLTFTHNATNISPQLTPGALVNATRFSGVNIGIDGLTVTAEDATQAELSQIIQCRADHPMPFSLDEFYFEVTILQSSYESIVGIGVCEEHFSSTGMPGWEPGSWGYHGDDGKLFYGKDKGKEYGPIYGTGDVVGCGGDKTSKTLFFTKNGEHLGLAASGIQARLFAMIGIGSKDVQVSVNFGSLPFQYTAYEGKTLC